MKVARGRQFFEAERQGNFDRLLRAWCNRFTSIHLHFRVPAHIPRGTLPQRLHFELRANGAPRSSSRSLSSLPVKAFAPRSEEAKHAGHYFRSHALHSLAIETAEACAEWLHRLIREDWGFPDLPRLQCRSASFRDIAASDTALGIPRAQISMTRLESGKLLHPDEIGVQLTEGMMMDPEASVSALVFQHPDCTYFGVGDSDERP